MAPAQLFSKRGDNLGVEKHFGKTYHRSQIPLRKDTTEFRCQFCRQCLPNLISIDCPILLEDIPADTSADMPIEQVQLGIDRPRTILSGIDDQLAQIDKQLISPRSPYISQKSEAFDPNMQNAIPKTLAKDFIRRVGFGLLASRDDRRRAAVKVRQRSRWIPFPTILPVLIS